MPSQVDDRRFAECRAVPNQPPLGQGGLGQGSAARPVVRAQAAVVEEARSAVIPAGRQPRSQAPAAYLGTCSHIKPMGWRASASSPVFIPFHGKIEARGTAEYQPFLWLMFIERSITWPVEIVRCRVSAPAARASQVEEEGPVSCRTDAEKPRPWISSAPAPANWGDAPAPTGVSTVPTRMLVMVRRNRGMADGLAGQRALEPLEHPRRCSWG